MTEALLSGLTPEQSDWARVSLDAVIAPAWSDQFDGLADELAGLDAEERWAGIVTAHYAAILAPLRAWAHELAAAPRSSEREAEAGAVLCLLDDLAMEMSEAAPEVFDALAPELADAAERCRECRPDGPFERGPSSES